MRVRRWIGADPRSSGAAAIVSPAADAGHPAVHRVRLAAGPGVDASRPRRDPLGAARIVRLPRPAHRQRGERDAARARQPRRGTALAHVRFVPVDRAVHQPRPHRDVRDQGRRRAALQPQLPAGALPLAQHDDGRQARRPLHPRCRWRLIGQRPRGALRQVRVDRIRRRRGAPAASRRSGRPPGTRSGRRAQTARGRVPFGDPHRSRVIGTGSASVRAGSVWGATSKRVCASEQQRARRPGRCCSGRRKPKDGSFHRPRCGGVGSSGSPAGRGDERGDDRELLGGRLAAHNPQDRAVARRS